jgi:hypothetical protein
VTDVGYILFDSLVTDYIKGRPDNPTSVQQISALQDQYAQMNQARAKQPGWVPETSLLQQPTNPLAETPTGPVYGNLPIVGWTAQNATGPAFASPPPPTGTGIDWTADVNPIGAGPYDMNQVVQTWPVNPLNQAPIGDNELFAGYPGNDQDPNFLPQDQGGTLDPLEY